MVGNTDLSLELYQDALGSDYVDIQGGTTGEGIHAGVMAGTILIALNTFAGINFRGEILSLRSNLPHNWKTMTFQLNFKGVCYQFELCPTKYRIFTDKQVNIQLDDQTYDLPARKWNTFERK
jgi:trehalose/maltose hydrolase-like predicted phosphorylase